MEEIEGYSLKMECPQCQGICPPARVLLTDKHTVMVQAWCPACKEIVYFDFTLQWFYLQFKTLFPQKALPLVSKDFTVKDLSDLHAMGIADEQKGGGE